jgi:hypothetical protein
MIDIVMWGLVALPYAYLLSRGCSWAYFESKFEYHKKVVKSYKEVME